MQHERQAATPPLTPWLNYEKISYLGLLLYGLNAEPFIH